MQQHKSQALLDELRNGVQTHNFNCSHRIHKLFVLTFTSLAGEGRKGEEGERKAEEGKKQRAWKGEREGAIKERGNREQKMLIKQFLPKKKSHFLLSTASNRKNFEGKNLILDLSNSLYTSKRTIPTQKKKIRSTGTKSNHSKPLKKNKLIKSTVIFNSFMKVLKSYKTIT